MKIHARLIDYGISTISPSWEASSSESSVSVLFLGFSSLAPPRVLLTLGFLLWVLRCQQGFLPVMEEIAFILQFLVWTLPWSNERWQCKFSGDNWDIFLSQRNINTRGFLLCAGNDSTSQLPPGQEAGWDVINAQTHPKSGNGNVRVLTLRDHRVDAGSSERPLSGSSLPRGLLL